MNDFSEDQSAPIEIRESEENSEVPLETIENSALDFEVQTDVQVQEAITEINQIEEIRPAVWQELDAGERLRVLQSVEDCMSAIQNRPSVAVSAQEMDLGTFGGWNGQSIQLNAAHLESEMPVNEFIDTIVHEGRHAFQDYAVQNPGVVSDTNVMDAWAENRDNYLNAEEFGQELYMAQPLEADAWAYASRISLC